MYTENNVLFTNTKARPVVSRLFAISDLFKCFAPPLTLKLGLGTTAMSGFARHFATVQVLKAWPINEFSLSNHNATTVDKPACN